MNYRRDAGLPDNLFNDFNLHPFSTNLPYQNRLAQIHPTYNERSPYDSCRLKSPGLQPLIYLSIMCRRDILTLIPVRWLCSIPDKVRPIPTMVNNINQKAGAVLTYSL